MQKNRQRRAAEARRRRRQNINRATREQTPAAEDTSDEQLGQAMDELLQIVQRRAWGVPADAAAFLARPEAVQVVAAANVVCHFVTQAVGYGWSDVDLREAARRRLPVASGDLLIALLDDLRGDRTWQSVRALRGSPTAVHHLIGAAALLSGLPRLPAAAVPSTEPTAEGVDERILRKVRALLAKAESTEYEAEAETFTAKAQELMSKYSIDRSLAESARRDTASGPGLRRMWVDAPYVSPKSSLINAVARANHCRCVESPDWGFVSVVGHPADLEIVDLLATSLLVQASRAMSLAGADTDRYGNSQTRSFRSSFLLAYAGRIGERLREANQMVEDEAARSTGGELVPVLAARDDAVEAQLDEWFPHLTSRRSRISNARGWGAGRAAADLARLDRRGSIAG